VCSEEGGDSEIEEYRFFLLFCFAEVGVEEEKKDKQVICMCDYVRPIRCRL
jgi:hypothetical protein